MLDYEKNFIDWERRRDEASWDGFATKDYSRMYEYIFHRIGSIDANYFNSLTKKEKRLFCARMVCLHHEDAEKRCKAKKFLDKHEGEDEIIWPKTNMTR